MRLDDGALKVDIAWIYPLSFCWLVVKNSPTLRKTGKGENKQNLKFAGRLANSAGWRWQSRSATVECQSTSSDKANFIDSENSFFVAVHLLPNRI